jgi:hypothetical protein
MAVHAGGAGNPCQPNNAFLRFLHIYAIFGTYGTLYSDILFVMIKYLWEKLLRKKKVPLAIKFVSCAKHVADIGTYSQFGFAVDWTAFRHKCDSCQGILQTGDTRELITKQMNERIQYQLAVLTTR